MPSSSSTRTEQIPWLGWPSDQFFRKPVQKTLREGWLLLPAMTGRDWIELYYHAVGVADWPSRAPQGDLDALRRFFDRWDHSGKPARGFLFRLLGALADAEDQNKLASQIVEMGIRIHSQRLNIDGTAPGIGTDGEVDNPRRGDVFDAKDVQHELETVHGRDLQPGAVRKARHDERQRRQKILDEWRRRFSDFPQ